MYADRHALNQERPAAGIVSADKEGIREIRVNPRQRS